MRPDAPPVPSGLAAHARIGFAAAAGMLLLVAGCGREPESAPPPAAAPTAKEAPPAAPAQPELARPPIVPAFLPLDDKVILATDTLETLKARHGAANVVADKVPGAEGDELDGWVLFPDDPAKRLYIYLDDASPRPAMASVLDPESRWERSDGIHAGLPLDELARRNGAPVKFLGFDWDYGGGVVGWNGGKLEHQPPLGTVQLCPPEDAIADGDSAYPMGDAEFDSDNAWVKAHPPVVCGFSVNLSSPAGPAP